MIVFNANEKIKVRLTEKGVEHYLNKYNEHLPLKLRRSYREIESMSDDEGCHTFQLWDFIDLFGGLGIRSSAYYGMDIIFNEKDFKKHD